MARKRFNYRDFAIPLGDGTALNVECSSVCTGDHVSQRAECYFIGYCWQGYAQWYNRPWEAYHYENAISKLAQKFENGGQIKVANAIREWSENHAKEKAEAAEKFVSDFKKEWDAARPSLREAIAAGAPFETESEANFALAALKMGNILNSLG